MEKPDLVFEDQATKIILSADGTAGDISEEMRSFLRYLQGMEPSSDFTQRLNNEVKKAREHKEWRGEYMTLWEKFEDAKEEGRKEGRILGTIETLREEGHDEKTIERCLMNKYGMSLPEAESWLYSIWDGSAE